MGRLIGWTIVSLLVLGVPFLRVENPPIQSPETPFPDPVISFDWSGFLIVLGIAAGIALVTWLILKRRK